MAKRRGNGEGGIFRRADGLWCASLTVGYAETGKRRRRVVYGKTKAEVQKKFLEIQSAAANGTLIDPNRMRLGDYLKHWLEDVARPAVRPTTHVRYESLIRVHILPHIGGILLSVLHPSHIQSFYSKLEKLGASPRTRELSHVILRKALQQAFVWGYLQNNPCATVKKPRVAKKTMRYLDLAGAKVFLEAAKEDRLYAIYVLALTTGLRQGEIFGLKWEDIDLNAETLAVRRTIYELSGLVYIGEPKSSQSRRKVELPNIAIIALINHRTNMLNEGQPLDWVFCDTIGGPLRKSNFRNNSHLPIIKRSGLPYLRFHDLRHTAATLLLSEGVHPKVVQERLGHSQISITLDTYSHVLPSLQKEAASKIDNLFA